MRGSDTITATPARALATRTSHGVRLLSDPGTPYRDGAEAEVLALVRQAADLSSLSDELAAIPTGWAQTYHLTSMRANALRTLDIPPTARVLEVGAGCGAISRWLGERCAVVDALEPVLERAVVARERCRDLPGVEVFAGVVDDLPAAPAYDLIVVVGVLEYVGEGTADREPYVRFLDSLRQRLAPGGALVLAIENRLGVKYLVGAPEDHTDRSFDSLEGYPYGGPARTFTRPELASLLAEAGLPVDRTLGAFPDYKLTRTVLDESIADLDPSLFHRIPRFPSPDWASPRPRLASEHLLWRTLVDAGRPLDFANSFVVLAGPGAAALWPAGQLASWLSAGRCSSQLMQARLQRESGSGAIVQRTLLLPTASGRAPTVMLTGSVPGDADATSSAEGANREVWVEESVEPYRPGTDVTELLAAATPPERQTLLKRWLELVRTLPEQDVPLDLAPHNLVLDANDELHVIDAEWRGRGWSGDDVIGRGVLWLSLALAVARPPQSWPGCATVADIAVVLADECGLKPGWLSRAHALESAFQAAVRGVTPDVTAAQLDEQLALRLENLPLGPRVGAQLAELEHLRLVLAQLEISNAAHEEHSRQLTAEVARVEAARVAEHRRRVYVEEVLRQSSTQRMLVVGLRVARRVRRSRLARRR
jgi:SAM-dependent methyltransferase